MKRTTTVPNPGQTRIAGKGPASISSQSPILVTASAGRIGAAGGEMADNRYDRLTDAFEAIIGRPATSIREYVANHPELFGSSQRARVFP